MNREPISQNYRINSKEGTFIFYAQLAARNENAGSYSSAEALWLKARRRARTETNKTWADCRAKFCRMAMRDDGLLAE